MEKMQDCEGGRKIEGDGGVGGVETFSAFLDRVLSVVK
jgi:hypothetical protein